MNNKLFLSIFCLVLLATTQHSHSMLTFQKLSPEELEKLSEIQLERYKRMEKIEQDERKQKELLETDLKYRTEITINKIGSEDSNENLEKVLPKLALQLLKSSLYNKEDLFTIKITAWSSNIFMKNVNDTSEKIPALGALLKILANTTSKNRDFYKKHFHEKNGLTKETINTLDPQKIVCTFHPINYMFISNETTLSVNGTASEVLSEFFAKFLNNEKPNYGTLKLKTIIKDEEDFEQNNLCTYKNISTTQAMMVLAELGAQPNN
jgi:hypothetical protein